MPSLAPFDVNRTKEERQMMKKIALQSLDETNFSAEKKKKKDSKNKADDSKGLRRRIARSESLGEDYKKEEMEIMMCAARLCLLHSSSRRPTMKTVNFFFHSLKKKFAHQISILPKDEAKAKILIDNHGFRFLGISNFWFSNMMVGQVNGMNLSGQRAQSMLVQGDKQNGGMQKGFFIPDVVAAYEYIFIWDEDLGVEHFNGEK
ncbi:hypothetical protein Patl1_27693 [Pistacia atlantica]|uniref:Uncharacterized protein n=1 Tax=Pistacia atlantica TaxID=434234 RepID=A0ACC1BGF3_9ROSI|nr:hypothetical protein Patl1_27693 [Pistacia atlantica]